MTRIILNEEQARKAAITDEFVELCDPNGNPVGYVGHGVTAEDIAIVEERMAKNPRSRGRTTEEAIEYLQSLRKL